MGGWVVVVVTCSVVLGAGGSVVLVTTVDGVTGSSVVVVSVVALQAATSNDKTTANRRIPAQLMPSLVL